ncbi:MAG: class I SAM-dependent methyltransferase [Bacteroidetes bacterium]|jgi:SAM-dependent methyltransferase|nr:class I SAM-dependent methyltransferase [Bacteroidota bacterium]
MSALSSTVTLIPLTDDVLELVKSIQETGPELVTAVHPDDEMYLFFITHPDHKDFPLRSYFLSGIGMLQEFQEILRKTGTSLENTKTFLEFACGYGRFTRHLVRCLDPGKITVSDVYKDAVDFQEQTFGVNGFYSDVNPEKVIIPGTYEIIFVASLFSHLPVKTWRPWLNKLYNSLTDNGILIFSTHGPSCMEDPGKMPGSGFLYRKMSESRSLSFENYGTTYVTNGFVLQAVKEETGQPVLLEVPKGLWNYQDVYVVRSPGSV